MSHTPRQKLIDALNGKHVENPVYMVYDWFVQNRKHVDWQILFDLGMGQINHACLVDLKYPHLEIEKKESLVNGQRRLDVYWKTDKGILHEWFLDEWRQEHLIKMPQDYKIMARAISDVKITPQDTVFEQSEDQLGDQGFTVGQFGHFGQQTFMRTPFQVIQIDYVGLEQFSMDIVYQVPELLELTEQMNHQLLDVFKACLNTRSTHIKLWENLSIETMGPQLYQHYLVPLYKKIFELLEPAGKKLIVHYDGKLKVIANDIRNLPFDGFDSLTPPPEGDLEIEQVRRLCPDTFLWIHPSLSWFALDKKQLISKLNELARQANHRRFCFQLSEEVPANCIEIFSDVLKEICNS